jgi:prepilin-type N-terminal cleavage/methylation domain-containing protein
MGTHARRAFTLVELLVVIAIIALLVATLLPALANAKKVAKMIRDQASLKEQTRGFFHYASDNHDAVIPAAPHWDWVHGLNAYEIKGPDPRVPRAHITGTVAKIWPIHMFGYLDWPWHQVQLDPVTYADFWSRPGETTPANGYTSYGAESYQAALQYHPTFGYNGVFIGGSYQHGAFRGPANADGITMPGPNPVASGGSFYVRQATAARYPSNLLVYATSRGGDVREGGWWGYGRTNPDSGVIRPGYWLITAPKPSPAGSGGMNQGFTLDNGWHPAPLTSNTWDDRRPPTPSTFGMIWPKHFKQVVTGMLDGHVAMQTLEELRDMRKWSNNATRHDWTFEAAR